MTESRLVVVDTDRGYAPMSYLVCRVFPHGQWSTRQEKDICLVSVDFDFPGLATCLGYIPCSECPHTDGTIDCEHHTALEMITDAKRWLDSHTGQPFEDPGYLDW